MAFSEKLDFNEKNQKFPINWAKILCCLLTWCSNSSNLLSFELSSLSLLLSAEVSNKGWRLWIGCSQEWTPRWFWTDLARANLTASSTAKCLEVRAKCVRLKPATRLTLGGKSKSERKNLHIIFLKKVHQKLGYIVAMFEKSGLDLRKLALHTYSFLSTEKICELFHFDIYKKDQNSSFLTNIRANWQLPFFQFELWLF